MDRDGLQEPRPEPRFSHPRTGFERFRGQFVPGLGAVGRKPAAVFVCLQRAAYEGEGALRALGAFAHLAAHADGGGCAGVVQVQPLGIDQLGRVPDVAAQADGKLFARLPPAGAAMRDGARNPQVGAPVGHDGHLPQDAVWLAEGFVDVPQR